MKRSLKAKNVAKVLKTTPLFVVGGRPRYAYGNPAEEILDIWPRVPRRKPSLRQKLRNFFRKITEVFRCP
jgi:hypothetical protein